MLFNSVKKIVFSSLILSLSLGLVFSQAYASALFNSAKRESSSQSSSSQSGGGLSNMLNSGSVQSGSSNSSSSSQSTGSRTQSAPSKNYPDFFAGPMRTVSLADFKKEIAAQKGKVIIVNFCASWCGPCLQEIPELIQFRKQYSDKEVVVVSLSLDDALPTVEDLKRKMGLNYPMHKAGEDLVKSFNIDSIPFNVIYDRSMYTAWQDSGMIGLGLLQEFMNIAYGR